MIPPSNNEEQNEIVGERHRSGLILPSEGYIPRDDAYLHANGVTVMNASTMFYGGAKTGKTRTIIKAFKGCDYFFLDFDRNYESTIQDIIDSGARYFNGSAAYDILYQLMDGNISNVTVVVDALGSVIKPLCLKFISKHASDGRADEEARMLQESIKGIGKDHADSVTFFNLIIEPMTRNGNSINFIHHTTQNMQGEKMEGNKGAWLSVFDFTYSMDRASKTFKLEAGRLPVALNSIGTDNIYDRINKTIEEKAETIEIDGRQKLLTKYSHLSANKNFRTILNPLVIQGKVNKIKNGRTEYLDANLKINAQGQYNRFSVRTLMSGKPDLDDQS